MPKRADAKRLDEAADSLERALALFRRTVPFLETADAAALQHRGLMIAVELRERIEWVEGALKKAREVAEHVQKRAEAEHIKNEPKA